MKHSFLALSFCSLMGLTLPGLHADAQGHAGKGVFIENKSQWDGRVAFKTSMPGMNFSVLQDALVYDFFEKENMVSAKLVNVKGQAVQMEFAGANNFSFKGREQEVGTYNYFLGNDQMHWVRNARSFKTLVAENVYNGIDAVVMLDNGLPRYDFVVHPGADPAKIQLAFKGADAVKAGADGSVSFTTKYGSIYNGKLLAYQVVNNEKRTVECSFVATGNTVRFKTGKYDTNLPLVIDPTVYSTYIGGGMDDEMTALKVDDQGNIVTVGWTASDDYTIRTGAYQSTFGQSMDGVVTKFNPSMTTVISSTYIGGGGDDAIRDVVLDAAGNIYVTGETNSTNFPTKSGGVSQTLKGGIDGFVCKLTSNGSDLQIATYIGGTKDDYGHSIAIDASSNIYFTGKTTSTDFFTSTGVYDRTHNGSFDAYAIKLSSSGSMLASTFLGGGGDDIAYDIQVDISNNVYIAGETESSNFSTSPVPSQFNGNSRPFDNVYNSGADGFISKFDNSLKTLTFSTYLGGSGDDRVKGIAIGPGEIVYIAGETTSNYGQDVAGYFPLGSQINGGMKSGSADVFTARLDKPGKLLPFTWLTGGSSLETVKDLVCDVDGNYYIVGTTTSSNYPATTDAEKKNLTGTSDGFYCKINTNGVLNAGLIGGNKTDVINGAALDSKSHLYLAGTTTSTNLAASTETFKNTLGGSSDGFVAKQIFATLEMNSPMGNEKWCGGSQQTLQWIVNGLSASERYAVYLSSDNENWQKIDSNLSGISYSWNIPTNLPTGNQYRIRVISSSGVANQSGAFTISQGPSIQSHPQGVTVCEGEKVELTVNVVSVSPTYQWFRNGEQITGATSATYSVPAATPANSGNYTVKITGVCGGAPITSEAAMVTVNTMTKLTTQPQNVTVNTGQTFTLTAAASGTGLSYQWERNKQKLTEATTSTLSISNATSADNGMYRVIVTGQCGADTSAEAQVTVDPTSIGYSELPNGSLKIENVMPNPAVTTAQILLKSTKESAVNVSIIDANGATVQEIFKGNINGNRTIAFDTKNLASGSYWIIAEQNGQKVRYELRVVR